MISAFFDKTKPVNFLVLLGFNFLLFWGVTFKFYGLNLNFEQSITKSLASLALVLSVFIMSTVVKTKKLSLDNSFDMLFFSLLLTLFFGGILDSSIIFCHFFLLLSMERALALKVERNYKEKVFESAFWLFVASLFVEWAILYLIPLYFTISHFCGKQLRIWLMPIAALFCVLIVSLAAITLFGDMEFFVDHYRFRSSLDFFVQPDFGLLTYFVLVLAMVLVVFGKLGYRRLGRTLSLRILFAFLGLAILISIFVGPVEKGIEVLSFFPAAVFLTNYVETIKKQRFREIVVVSSILFPLIAFGVRLLQ